MAQAPGEWAACLAVLVSDWLSWPSAETDWLVPLDQRRDPAPVFHEGRGFRGAVGEPGKNHKQSSRDSVPQFSVQVRIPGGSDHPLGNLLVGRTPKIGAVANSPLAINDLPCPATSYPS